MTRRSSRPPPHLGPQATLDAHLEQTPVPFAESSLPLTMELAAQHRARVEQLLEPDTAVYPFEDRVLLMLAPYWRPDVEGFHEAGGDSLERAHEPHKLRRFDEHYRKELERLLAAES